MAEQPADRPSGFRSGNPPWWLHALVVAAAVGLFTGAYHAIRSGDPAGGLTAGAFNAVVVGLPMGAVMAWMNRRAASALEGIPPEHRRAAQRAARGGPVPADPAVREAALRLATTQLDLFTRVRPWALVGAGAFGVLGVLGGIFLNPLLWVGVVAAVLLAALYLVQGVRLPRRVAVLRGTATAERPAAG